MITRLGIDLGGSKIEGVALAADGTELDRRRCPTPKGDYDATLKAVADLVSSLTENLVDETKTIPVGVGIPGALSPETGLVKNANSTCLIGRKLDSDLERILGRPVRLANDANCFAVSEATDGAATGKAIVFGVILGTGVGGSIALQGEAFTGKNAISGEWGHNPLPWPKPGEQPGPLCYCGKHGCLETFLSGPGLSRDHKHTTGNDLSADQIASLVGNGDQAAIDTMERYLDRLARGLASVINVLDPDAIVLGGGLSNIDCLYQEIPKRLGAYVFSDRVSTPVIKNMHGDSSGVRGAAWLWPIGN